MSTSSSSSSSSSGQWNAQTEILASSMMLVTISENDVIDLQHNSRSLSSSTIGGSGESLSGWGSTASRKSYKVDLNLLAQQSAQQEFKNLEGHGTSMDAGDDSWGFFDSH